ncbi:MAG: alpha/beta hydrolase [Agromyces sp.]
MPSPASRAYRAAVKRAGGRNSMLRASQAQAYVDAVRLRPESVRPPKGVLRSVEVHHRQLSLANGVTWPMYDIVPPGLPEDSPSVLYLHGGAYVGQIGQEAWYFAARLAAQAKQRVTVAIYPLIPFVTADRLVAQTHDVLLQELARSPRMTLVGDSAGGGLALAATMSARDAGDAVPTGLVLISPWTDIRLAHSDVAARARRDVMLAPAGLRHFGDLYRGSLDPTDWRVSPLFGALEGLPPMQVFAAEDDVLYSDAVRLAESARESNHPHELHIGERMLHVWPLANIPEGVAAMAEIVRFCGGHRQSV